MLRSLQTDVGHGGALCSQLPKVQMAVSALVDSLWTIGQRLVFGSSHPSILLTFSIVEAELVRWSTDGSLFVVQTLLTMDIYSTVCDLLWKQL